MVLEAALRASAGWRHDAGVRVPVAVNLSVRSLLDTSIVEDVAELLARTATDPGDLTLEITESAVMGDVTRTRAALDRLHQLGVKLSIDDFGTGYSSLSYLKRLPVDEVKIDKSFVLTLVEDPKDEAIVRSVIELGHNLGMRVVAEGVETQEAWSMLQRLGCDTAQGYLLSRPVADAEFLRWLVRSGRESASPTVPSHLRLSGHDGPARRPARASGGVDPVAETAPGLLRSQACARAGETATRVRTGRRRARRSRSAPGWRRRAWRTGATRAP